MSSTAKYASDDTMLQDAEWFEAHADQLEAQAKRYRMLAKAARSAARTADKRGM